MSAGVHLWPSSTRDLHIMLHWERCLECKRQLHETGPLTCEPYLRLRSPAPVLPEPGREGVG